jgi:hypothetical protein
MKLRGIGIATAVAILAISTMASNASAQTIVPLPKALAVGHPFATQKTPTELRGWGPGANDPGNCPGNRSEITGNASEVTLSTSGKTGDCTDIELPHTYPTVNGSVYEARMYFSNFGQWLAYWQYGNNWPYGGETDAVEAQFGVNYVSYHYAPCSNQRASSEYSTNPWAYTCKTTLPVHSANLGAGWHTVDIAYGNHAVSIYYDGNLYTTVSGPNVVNGPSDPNWIVFSTGSCNAAGYNSCANGQGAPGYIEIQWLRMFT